jgi:DNA-binding response OmpR family regulator
MNQSQHIVVVDDEAPMRETVGEYLRLHGFQVTLCDGGRSLRQAIAKEPPDLIVLDLNMQEEDGLSIVRALKQQQTAVPIIMFSATASPIDRVVGLEIGADDYLAKGSELRELLARIRSVLRRTGAIAASPPAAAALHARAAAPVVVTAPQPAAPIRFGTKWLDLGAQVLRDDAGTEYPLAGTEFALLKAFAENPRRVLSRDRLLDLAGARDDAFDRAIDVRITRLRKKIEPDPDRPSVIRTVRGAGYLFAPDGKDAA